MNECQYCHKKFKVKDKHNANKYCSKKCHYADRKGKPAKDITGLSLGRGWNSGKHYKMAPRKNWVYKPKPTKICIFCNKSFEYSNKKDKFCTRQCYWKYKKGKPSSNPEGLRAGWGYGWKGNFASYESKHGWVRYHKGKAKICDHCGKSNVTIDWANKDHKYSRNLKDYISLCRSCHRKHDYKFL